MAQPSRPRSTAPRFFAFSSRKREEAEVLVSSGSRSDRDGSAHGQWNGTEAASVRKRRAEELAPAFAGEEDWGLRVERSERARARSASAHASRREARCDVRSDPDEMPEQRAVTHNERVRVVRKTFRFFTEVCEEEGRRMRHVPTSRVKPQISESGDSHPPRPSPPSGLH